MSALTADEIQANLEFEVGQRYFRKDLHDVCGGNHQPGISPVTDLSAIFLFGSTTESQYGYRDEWLPNDHFLLTGVGRDGDQSWDGLNSSLASHHEDGRRVFLFEKIPGREPTVVTYVGEFEYVNHREDTIPDRSGELRRAYRFEVRPVEGGSLSVPDEIEDAPLEELYELAEQASPTSTSGISPIGDSGSSGYTRSDVVQAFALRVAKGVCQGCGEPAPFENEGGDPHLEVHHLHRLSDGGPDHPDNVIAVCPNCHARVHHGADGDEFNETLVQRAESLSEQVR